jgi:hypothetical protein
MARGSAQRYSSKLPSEQGEQSEALWRKGSSCELRGPELRIRARGRFANKARLMQLAHANYGLYLNQSNELYPP